MHMRIRAQTRTHVHATIHRRLVVGSDHIAASGDFYSHVLLSDDGGATWSLSAAIPDGNECQVAQLANGSLLVNMRFTDKRRHFAWSHDDGETWTAPTVAPLERFSPLGSDCEGSTVVLPDSGLVVFSTPFSAAGRENLTLFTYVVVGGRGGTSAAA
jgi:sialidase-1